MVAKLSLLVKLASIAVHAEEYFSINGHTLDREAIKGLLADSEIQECFADLQKQALLPVKRNKQNDQN